MRSGAGRLAAGGAAALLVLAAAAPAVAAPAERTGWWNRVSAGALVLPAPATQPGDLRVAGGLDGPTAYAAALFTAPGATAATLELAVRPDSAVGAPDVVACPTVMPTWPAGENQPYDLAPPFDCTRGQAVGIVSEDGTTLSFDLDAGTQSVPGTWSLALVPTPESTTPFVVDLQQPGPQAFTAAPPQDGSAPPVAEPEPEPDSAPPMTGSGGAGPATGFDASVPFEVPAADPAAFAPQPADSAVDAPATAAAPGPAASAPAPALAGPVPAAALPRTFAARPVAQAQPGVDGRRLLALLALVGLAGAVGYAAGRPSPQPRLLGGRAGSAALDVGTVVPAAVAPAARDRGIGRFAKARDAAPRRLR